MTVKELKDRLGQFPDNVEAAVQKRTGIHHAVEVKYDEDYAYGTTFKYIILEDRRL